MAGMQPREKPDGTWAYPLSEKLLEMDGLFMVSHYIEGHRQTILKFIVNCPIFHLCKDAVRLCDTSACQYWWEQPMDLEAAKTLLSDLDAEDVPGP